MKHNENLLNKTPLEADSSEGNEIKKLLGISSAKQYNTFIDITSNEKKNLLITDIDQLTVYRENLINKLKLNSIIFSLILLLQSILHVYISFKSYNFYQNTLKQVYNFNVRLIVIQVSIVLIGKTI